MYAFAFCGATSCLLSFEISTTEDASGLLGNGDDTHMVGVVPLECICICKPDEMPCIEDFSSSRLHREPLDLNVSGDPKSENFLMIKKGFTRLRLSKVI